MHFRATWPFLRSNLLLRASPGCPEARFWSPGRLFFRSFSTWRALHVQNVRHRKNTVKTNTKRTSELPRIDRKSIKNPSASASDSVWRCERRYERLGSCPGGSWSVSRAARGRFWTVPGRSWPARGVPRSGLGRHWGVQKSFRARLDVSPKRPWAPEPAQDPFFVEFLWILASFSSIFERFFMDFRSSRQRRSHKIRISKRSRVSLTARLGSCGVQSLRTARTSFEMLFEHYMFSLFSLRTHKPT